MGAITGMLGLGGGPSVASPVNGGQLANAQNQANNGLGNQQNFATSLGAQNSIGNQSSVFNQLQGVANGTGPNPAQAMLNQATGQNVANQASLAAGQRGAAGNVGLMSRQAAQQGSNAQQQAAGQGATMQANQSLNALGQMGGIANNQVTNQQNALNSAAQNATQLQQNVLGAQGAANSANAGIQSNQETAGAGLLGGLGNAAGSALHLGSSLFAQGGPVGSPMSSFGQLLANGYAQGGQVPVRLSPGEIKLTPQQVKQVQAGADPMKVGGVVPGKPKVGGAKNSYANDTYSTTAQPGSIIVPRSETQSKNPSRNSKAFVDATLAKKGKK